jgi:hypothetical protein
MEMAPTSPDAREADARGAARSSIYLAAALYCDGCSSAVRIRNISATGALIEGAVIPGTGSLVQLVRGGLIVHALVAWSAERRCGLKFSGSIDVHQWRAAPTNGEQHRVDEVVRLVKAGAVPLPVPPLSHTSARSESGVSAAALSADLRNVSELLDKLGETLSGDLQVVARHGPALQNLDIAMQVICAVSAILDSREDSEGETTKLAALRRSADQALRRMV